MTDENQTPVPEPAPSEAAAPDEAEASAADTNVAAEKPETSVQQSAEGRTLDQAGRERPQFLLGFPEHPELLRLSTAFEAGNYALVRAEAEAVAERAQDPAVRDAALELRRRIDPDPLVKYLLALAVGLLLFLASFAFHH